MVTRFLELACGRPQNASVAYQWGIDNRLRTPGLKLSFSSGLSLAVNVINYNLNVYYAVILAWALRYFFASMAPELPWVSCGNEWNTNSCVVYGKNYSSLFENQTNASSSVQEYWE